MKEPTRWKPRVTRRRLLLLATIALLATAGEATRRRWAEFRRLSLHHASMEQFCRDAAGTYSTREFWDPVSSSSAASEAERHGRLRRCYETRW